MKHYLDRTTRSLLKESENTFEEMVYAAMSHVFSAPIRLQSRADSKLHVITNSNNEIIAVQAKVKPNNPFNWYEVNYLIMRYDHWYKLKTFLGINFDQLEKYITEWLEIETGLNNIKPYVDKNINYDRMVGEIPLL